MTTSPPTSPPPAGRWPSRLFVPILAGATLRERLVGCLGALVGIGATALVGVLAIGFEPMLPMIMAPAGASAVLLFAVPASPLAQPWSIVGGNTVSALVGIAVAAVVDQPVLAAGLACSLAIAAMSLARCLHPPGGAVALTAVVGGPAVVDAGLGFALVPVALNSVVLVALGLAFHRLTRRTYPHRAPTVPANPHGTGDLPPQLRVGFSRADVDEALAAIGETLDVDRGDLERVLRQVERQSLVRQTGDIRCADLMSRDLVAVRPNDSPAAARSLLLTHGIRSLPVIDRDGGLVGVVGLRELGNPAAVIGDVMAAAATAAPEAPALTLLDRLTDGRTHVVVVTDRDRRPLGVVTQTDLLAAMARLAIPAPPAAAPFADAAVAAA